MTENGIEAYLQYPCRIAASGVVPRHINDGLMDFGFSTVVAAAELESLQVLFAAIGLRS